MKNLIGIFAMLLASSAAFASGTSQDQGIFDALVNVSALALPTAFPYAGYDKRVGRLDCRHMINTQNKIETYSCDLIAVGGSQDQDIFDALVNVPALALPTAYPYIGYDKTVGRLNCRHVINTETKVESYSCDLQ